MNRGIKKEREGKNRIEREDDDKRGKKRRTVREG